MIRRTALALALFVPLLPLPAAAGRTRWFSTGGVAILGYDVVAYFTENAAVEGSPEHSVKWNGAIWYFNSDENRAAFEMNPRAYVPQYGGYCAYAMAMGQQQASTPSSFSIMDGKLYLHRSDEERALWKAHFADYVSQADAHWPTMGKD